MSTIICVHMITNYMQSNPSSNHLDCELSIKELFYLLGFNVIVTQLYSLHYQHNTIQTSMVHRSGIHKTFFKQLSL